MYLWFLAQEEEEEEEEIAKLERIQALVDMSEEEYEGLDPQQQKEIDRLQHSRSTERRKQSVYMIQQFLFACHA